MAWVNGDIMLRSVMLQIGFVSFLFYGAAFGDVVLAANQVLLQFLYITAYALDGFAFAAEALVGQSLGARNRAALRRAVFLNGVWAVFTVILLALAFAVFGNWLIAAMAKSVAVQQAAGDYLFWMVLAPIMGGAAWLLDGVFIGATRTADMRNMMFVSLCTYFVAIWLLLDRFGNHGLWAALLIMFVVRGVTLALRYPSLEAEADA
jgi:MATE family multidrug resistance protein